MLGLVHKDTSRALILNKLEGGEETMQAPVTFLNLIFLLSRIL
jgi:hypothetical protein